MTFDNGWQCLWVYFCVFSFYVEKLIDHINIKLFRKQNINSQFFSLLERNCLKLPDFTTNYGPVAFI